MTTTRYAALPDVGLTEVYPVGVLHALQIAARALTVRGIPRDKRLPMARAEIRKEVRYLRHQIGERNWRAVRNSFNGYLAEPYTMPEHMTRCGRGWTTTRAIDDLLRHHATTLDARRTRTDHTEGDRA